MRGLRVWRVACASLWGSGDGSGMYNLLVGLLDGTVPNDRLFEYTDPAIAELMHPARGAALLSLPTLFMPEVGGGQREVARVGNITHVSPGASSGSPRNLRSDWRFGFTPAIGVAEIPLHRIEDLAGPLHISDFEFHRTHWAVKEADLHGVLQRHIFTPTTTSSVLRLPRSEPRQDDLVGVMMPFDGKFAGTWEALQIAVTEAGLECRRADQIWENHAVIDDIVDLIWRARVIIADFTGRNPNVFYETGIAHALGRDVIYITQSEGDVPFDLRHLRFLQYYPNGEGLQDLQPKVTERLRSLLAQR